jgi:hypothetical protein
MSVYWGLKKRMTDKEYVVIKHPLRFNGNVTVGGIKFCSGCGVVEKDSKAFRNIFNLPMFKKAKVLPLTFLKKVGFKPKDVQLIYGPDIYYHFIKDIGLNPDLTPIKREVEQPFSDVTVEDLTEAELAEDLEKSLESEEIAKVPEEQREEEKIVAMEPEEVEEIKEELAEELKEEQEEELPALSTEEIIEAHRVLNKCIRVLEDNTVCENMSTKGSPSGYCVGHIRYDTERKNYGKKERRNRKKKKEEE